MLQKLPSPQATKKFDNKQSIRLADQPALVADLYTIATVLCVTTVTGRGHNGHPSSRQASHFHPSEQGQG